jgi:hypothetical protein
LGNSNNPKSVGIVNVTTDSENCYIIALIDNSDKNLVLYKLLNNTVTYISKRSLTNSISNKSIYISFSKITNNLAINVNSINVKNTTPKKIEVKDKDSIVFDIKPNNTISSYDTLYSKLVLGATTNNSYTITINTYKNLYSVIYIPELKSISIYRYYDDSSIQSINPIITINNLPTNFGTHIGFVRSSSIIKLLITENCFFNLYDLPYNVPANSTFDYLFTTITTPTNLLSYKVEDIDTINKIIYIDVDTNVTTNTIFDNFEIIKTSIRILQNSNILIEGFVTSSIQYITNDGKKHYKVKINFSTNNSSNTTYSNISIKIIKRNKITNDIFLGGNDYSIPANSTDNTFTPTNKSIILTDGFYICGDESTAILNAFIDKDDKTFIIAKKKDKTKTFDYKNAMTVNGYVTPEYSGSSILTDSLQNVINGSVICVSNNYVYEKTGLEDSWRCISDNKTQSYMSTPNPELNIVSVIQTAEGVMFAVILTNGMYTLYDKCKITDLWSKTSMVTDMELASIAYIESANQSDSRLYGISPSGQLYELTVSKRLITDSIKYVWDTNNTNMNNIKFTYISAASSSILYLIGYESTQKVLYKYNVSTKVAELLDSNFDGEAYVERVIAKNVYKLKKENNDFALSYFTPEQISYFTPEQISYFTPEQLLFLSQEQLQAFTPNQIKKLTLNQLALLILNNRSIVFNQTQIQALTQNQIEILDLDSLSDEQLGFLTKEQVESITIDQICLISINKFKKITIMYFTIEQLTYCTADQIPCITVTQIQAFTTDQISTFIKDQIKAFTADQIKAFTADQIKAFTADQINNFEITQLASLTQTQVLLLTAPQTQLLSIEKLWLLLRISAGV